MRKSSIVNGFGVVVILGIACFPAWAMSGKSCEALAQLSLDQTIHIAAHDIAAGPFTPPGEKDPIPGGDLPAFCRVQLTVAPQINIEVWLPKDTWNERYQGVGGGVY